jgi:DNA-directed RNA polymerase specialized sigma subunit
MKKAKKVGPLDDLIAQLEGSIPERGDDAISSTDALSHLYEEDLEDMPWTPDSAREGSVEDALIAKRDWPTKVHDKSIDYDKIKEVLKVAEEILTELEFNLFKADMIGQSQTDSAKVYNISDQQVSMTLNRAIKKLQGYYQEE